MAIIFDSGFLIIGIIMIAFFPEKTIYDQLMLYLGGMLWGMNLGRDIYNYKRTRSDNKWKHKD